MFRCRCRCRGADGGSRAYFAHPCPGLGRGKPLPGGGSGARSPNSYHVRSLLQSGDYVRSIDPVLRIFSAKINENKVLCCLCPLFCRLQSLTGNNSFCASGNLHVCLTNPVHVHVYVLFCSFHLCFGCFRVPSIGSTHVHFLSCTTLLSSGSQSM